MWITRFLALMLVGAMLTFTLVGTPANAADIPDAWLTMRTKVALMTAEGMSAMDLNVDTVNGVVTLHGKVTTEAEKEKAERISRDIGGVKQVNNLLQIVPTAKREVVERADNIVKDGVEAAFKANRRITDSGVKVNSVNDGVVLLGGKTKSMEAYLESVEVAYAVKGVRRVATEVEVTTTPSTSF